MWWDWTQITVLDSVLFSILSIAILYFVGSGFLKLISFLAKRNSSFSSFDFLQRMNAKILFGFVFIFTVVLLCSIFNISYLISGLLIIGIAIVGFIVKRSKLMFKPLNRRNLRNYVFLIVVFAVLFATVLLSSYLISGNYGTTNDDGAEHTIVVSFLLNNPSVLISRGPQLLYYPSGAHVLSAFFVTLLAVPIQKIIVMLSAVLPCLIALSFYSTIKSLYNSKAASVFGLVMAAFFTAESTFGPIPWGGLPLLLSFYLLAASVGLIYEFLIKEKITATNALFLGLIFFIASQTYPVALLLVFLWFVLVGFFKIFSKFSLSHRLTISSFGKINYSAVVAFLVPMFLSIPYFYSVYVRNIAGHPLSYLNPPVTVSADATKLQIGFDWLLDIHALSQFFSSFGMLITLAGFTLIILLILFIPQVHQRIESILPKKKFAHVFSLVYLFLLVILAYLTLTLYIPINFMTILFSPERVLGNVFIPAIILTATILFLAVYFSYFTFKRLLGKGEGTILLRSKRNKLLVYALLALLIFNVGLSSIAIITEQQKSYEISRSSFNTFETLGAGDVSLMKWISQNIALDANILVSSGDSGQFVSSVTQRPTISRYSPFENFGDLILLLSFNSSDLKAVPLMIEFNVSYVYIGSIATTYGLGTYYYRHFNATQFLATPYFTLTKEVDNAWLFQFNASSALSAFNNYGSTD